MLKKKEGARRSGDLGVHLVSRSTYCAVGALPKDLTPGPQDRFFIH